MDFKYGMVERRRFSRAWRATEGRSYCGATRRRDDVRSFEEYGRIKSELVVTADERGRGRGRDPNSVHAGPRVESGDSIPEIPPTGEAVGLRDDVAA